MNLLAKNSMALLLQEQTPLIQDVDEVLPAGDLGHEQSVSFLQSFGLYIRVSWVVKGSVKVVLLRRTFPVQERYLLFAHRRRHHHRYT